MNSLVYVDGQAVILLDGVTANIDLEYDESADEFVVTADCENWINDMIQFHQENGEEWNWADDTCELARADCREFSGRYRTLREINSLLDKFCEVGSYEWFRWEYEDGTPVE